MVGLMMSAAAVLAADYGGGGGGGAKRRPEADCLVGVAGAPSGKTLECTDCDPSCDADGTGSPDGACTFRLQVCLNLPGVVGCEPTALRRASAKPRSLFPEGSVPAPPADASSACGAFSEVVVRTRKGGSRPGRKKIRLVARSVGKPKQADRDAFQLVCRPLASGQACGAITTTTTPVTSTTIPLTCGNGVIDGGEQCDGMALGGETCASRGFTGGTLACAPSCTFDVSGCTAPPSSCTIDMEASCPDTAAVCGATFTGGSGCFFEGKTGCYDSGVKAYKIINGQTLTIDLSPDIVGVEMFFVAEGGAAGTMTFRDAMGVPVGSPRTTNGNCLASMPPRQQVTFPTPVRTIEVTATGGVVWVDSLTAAR